MDRAEAVERLECLKEKYTGKATGRWRERYTTPSGAIYDLYEAGHLKEIYTCCKDIKERHGIELYSCVTRRRCLHDDVYVLWIRVDDDEEAVMPRGEIVWQIKQSPYESLCLVPTLKPIAYGLTNYLK